MLGNEFSKQLPEIPIEYGGLVFLDPAFLAPGTHPSTHPRDEVITVAVDGKITGAVEAFQRLDGCHQVCPVDSSLVKPTGDRALCYDFPAF